MITIVMAGFDKKARVYLTPFFVSHVDVGIRGFANAVNSEGSPAALNPEDFSLWKLGTFNDETAQFELMHQPEHVVEALSLKRARVETFNGAQQGAREITHVR